MAADINGKTDAQTWTERIQDALAASGGPPAPQRREDEPLGLPSLLGPPQGSRTAPPARRAELGLPPALARPGDEDALPF